MTGVRNSNVANGIVTAAGITVVYTVPAENVFLLKDLRLQNQGAAAATVSVYLNQPGVVGVLLKTIQLTAGLGDGYAGWVALNAGQGLYFNISPAEAIAYWISGALLPEL